MTDATREQHIRKQAITAIELLKGFTPEERAMFNNAVKAVEELAGYILELTNGSAFEAGRKAGIEEALIEIEHVAMATVDTLRDYSIIKAVKQKLEALKTEIKK